MRREVLNALIADLDAASASNDTLDESMQFWVENFGGRAAGWLIASCRKQLLRDGAFDFNIPVSAKSPPWFRVAIETLKRRASWTVTIRKTATTRTYRVHWVHHNRYRRQTAAERPS